MLYTNYIVGFNNKGIFWCNFTKHFLVKMRYSLGDYKHNDVYLLPLSDKSTMLIEHYKTKREVIEETDGFQLLEADLYGLEIHTNGNIYLLHNEKTKRYISKVLLPKPKTGFTVICPANQDIGIALTISSNKYKDYKTMLVAFAKEFNVDYSVEEDFYYLEFE